MLGHVARLLKQRHLEPIYISAVVMAEKPKLAGFIPRMREHIARTLGVSDNVVNIGATTTEKTGVIGEGKAIAAEAFVLVGE